MNQREKEKYLRDYSVLKSAGKPFFPYAVAKDSVMACVVMLVIIALSLVLGVGQGPKVNPTTTTYDPRPDWYFFFLFELLRVIKPPSLTGLAMVGIPTLGMILLFLLPFFDRSPERRPERRPIAMATFIFVVVAMALLTYQGASVGPPTELALAVPKVVAQQGPAAVNKFEEGRLAVAQSGCEDCHDIAGDGNNGPGPELTHVGSRIPAQAIARTLTNPTAPMPSFKGLPARKFEAIEYFLSQLK